MTGETMETSWDCDFGEYQVKKAWRISAKSLFHNWFGFHVCKVLNGTSHGRSSHTISATFEYC